jgi:hypothetical protein
MEKPTQQKETRQQRPHANLPARFAFRQQRKQRNNTKRAGATSKKTHKSMGIAFDTIGLCTKELTVYYMGGPHDKTVFPT